MKCEQFTNEIIYLSLLILPEDMDCGLLSVSSSLEEKTSLRRGVRLKIHLSCSMNLKTEAFLTVSLIDVCSNDKHNRNEFILSNGSQLFKRKIIHSMSYLNEKLQLVVDIIVVLISSQCSISNRLFI